MGEAETAILIASIVIIIIILTALCCCLIWKRHTIEEQEYIDQLQVYSEDRKRRLRSQKSLYYNKQILALTHQKTIDGQTPAFSEKGDFATVKIKTIKKRKSSTVTDYSTIKKKTFKRGVFCKTGNPYENGRVVGPENNNTMNAYGYYQGQYYQDHPAISGYNNNIPQLAETLEPVEMGDPENIIRHSEIELISNHSKIDESSDSKDSNSERSKNAKRNKKDSCGAVYMVGCEEMTYATPVVHPCTVYVYSDCCHALTDCLCCCCKHVTAVPSNPIPANGLDNAAEEVGAAAKNVVGIGEAIARSGEEVIKTEWGCPCSEGCGIDKCVGHITACGEGFGNCSVFAFDACKNNCCVCDSCDCQCFDGCGDICTCCKDIDCGGLGECLSGCLGSCL